MKITLCSAATVLAVLSNANPLANTERAAVDLPKVPAGCLTSPKGIHVGMLPDDESGGKVSMSSLNALIGKKLCFFGDYSHISSTSYDGSDITNKVGQTDDAIMVPSIMPTGVTWDQVDANMAKKIGNAVKAFTDKNITVYLRFAHEVNCYGKPGCASPAYPGGTDYAGFKKAWANVAAVCRGIDGCYMVRMSAYRVAI